MADHKPSIRFKGFTDTWEQRKLGELSEKTFGGGTPKTSNESFWKGNIPWIQSSDLIEDSLFDVEPRKYISPEAVDKSATKLVPENSVAIVTRVGVGKLAFMPFSYAASQDFLSLSVLKTEPQFTVYALYKKLQSELNAVQGTSIKGVTKDELLAKEIMIPCYEEQEKIGSYLHSLDNLITLHQRECENLQNIKKSMLQKMFPKNGEQFPEVRFAGFTDAWEQRKLGEIANRVIVGLATSVTPYYRESGIPILRNLNIKENRLDDSDLLFLDPWYAASQKGKQIHTGDVITVHTGYIGISCVVPEKYDNCLTFTTLITTPNDEILDGYFLSQYLNSDQGLAAVKTVTTQGGRQNLNTNDFIKVQISFPSLDEQKRISEFLSNLDHLITLHQRKVEILKNIKTSMLQNMFI